jgi:hypothetical protein
MEQDGQIAHDTALAALTLVSTDCYRFRSFT